MRISVFVILLLATAFVSARADTLSVRFTDAEGRICSAYIIIDDETRHPILVNGIDYEGRAYSTPLQTFAADFEGCGAKIGYYSRGGYWYFVSPGDDGVLCGVGRMGGPGYSSARYSYRVGGEAEGEQGPTEARPDHE